jgi:DNA polymerase elongation subunit (family B)
MGWNISPETFYKKIDMPSINNMLSVMSTGPAKLVAEQSSCSLTAHGCLYRNNKQGFFPALMEKMFNDRVTARKKLAIAKKENQKNPTKELQNEISRLDNLQKARKIQINAGYGAMANKWFRFFNADMAESVTSTGQFAIQFTENKVNAFLNKNLRTKDVDYVIASDTDSLYITLEPIINKTFPDGASTGAIVEFCDKVCSSTIEPFLEQCFVEFTTLTNAFAQKLSMKREVIADKAIWRKAKHYIMNVWDKEGLRLKESETLIHGIEAVRSSTPMICRNKIKEALKIIMNGTESELQGFIQSFRNEFFELPFEDIAFPRSMSHLGKYSDAGTIYIKATPIHVKGALVYNHWVKENELEKKLELVHNGNKVKFCYLSLPNPMKCNVLATPNRLPQEMQFMNKYLNRDQQFIKAFLDPIQSIIELIDWKTTKSATLESFFT